jgi:hypothetical protein
MNVTDKLQKIRLLLTNNGLIPILKKMANPSMPSIIAKGITRQQTPHKKGNSFGSAQYQKVCMIAHKDPCQYSDSSGFN